LYAPPGFPCGGLTGGVFPTPPGSGSHLAPEPPPEPPSTPAVPPPPPPAEVYEVDNAATELEPDAPVLLGLVPPEPPPPTVIG